MIYTKIILSFRNTILITIKNVNFRFNDMLVIFSIIIKQELTSRGYENMSPYLHNKKQII